MADKKISKKRGTLLFSGILFIDCVIIICVLIRCDGIFKKPVTPF